MKTPKTLAMIETQTLDELGHHFERNLNFHVDSEGRQFWKIDGPEIASLAKLDRLVRLVLETDLVPFRIRVTMRWESVTVPDVFGRNHRVRQPRYVKVAAPNSFSNATEGLANFFSSRELRGGLTVLQQSNPAANQLLHAPHIRLFMDVFFRHRISECLGGAMDTLVDAEGHTRAEIYNDFSANFHRAMRDSESLRQEWHNWNLGSHENAANLSRHLDRLFEKHGSLTVLHLRLFHAKERTNLITSPVEAQIQDLQMLRACRTRFLDRLRRKPALFTDEPGYVWAILPSLEGGYDLHFTLLFSTVALRRVLADKTVEAGQLGVVLQDHADQVGAYWVQMATGGQGSYLRGDANAVLYGPDWVHGEVRADDVERRGKLMKSLGYLAMRRALVRLKNEPPGQYFGLPERKVRRSRRRSRTAH